MSQSGTWVYQLFRSRLFNKFHPFMVSMFIFGIPMFIFLGFTYHQFNERVAIAMVIGSLWAPIGPYLIYLYETKLLSNFWSSVERDLDRIVNLDNRINSNKEWLKSKSSMAGVFSTIFFILLFTFGGYTNLGLIYQYGLIVIMFIAPSIGTGLVCLANMVKVINFTSHHMSNLKKIPDFFSEIKIYGKMALSTSSFFFSGTLFVPLARETINDFIVGFNFVSIGTLTIFFLSTLSSIVIPFVNLISNVSRDRDIELHKNETINKMKLAIYMLIAIFSIYTHKNQSISKKILRKKNNYQLLENAISIISSDRKIAKWEAIELIQNLEF